MPITILITRLGSMAISFPRTSLAMTTHGLAWATLTIGVTEYGLSEFLVRVGAPFEVAYTMPIMDFVEHMKQQVKQEEQEAPEDQ